jgi:hypothetical protein
VRKTAVIALAVVLALGLVGLVKAWSGSSNVALAAVATRYQQTDSRIAYTGTWIKFSTTGASGGSYTYADSAAQAVIWFSGTKLDIIATKGYTQGKAKVTLDGVDKGTIDFSNTTTLRQQNVWSTGTVASGTHKVVLSWTGQPGVKGGTRINVDAVDIIGSLVAAGSTTTTTAGATTTTVRPTTTTTKPPLAGTTVPANSNLQTAINAAASGATLLVPAGTYGAVQITKPLKLVGQPGAVISGGTYGVYIKASGVTVQGFTVKGFGFTGIYCNGPLSNLTVRDCVIDGGNRAVFGLHFQNASTSTGVSGVTIENVTARNFTSSSSYNYPAHGIYLKQVRNLTMRGVDAGYTAGVGTHSAISLCDVTTALVENSVGHHSMAGIAVNDYPEAGCRYVTIRTSGGHSNVKEDRRERGVNYNITWESSCYGTFRTY